MIRIIVLGTFLLALAGCVVPFGDSTGPGDNRSPYFSNRGDPNGSAPDEQGMVAQQSLGLR